MAPIWDPSEQDSGLYSERQEHSEGMISFVYRPTSAEDMVALENTETYRNLMVEDHAQSEAETEASRLDDCI
jgi:hypothetical protein